MIRFPEEKLTKIWKSIEEIMENDKWGEQTAFIQKTLQLINKTPTNYIFKWNIFNNKYLKDI